MRVLIVPEWYPWPDRPYFGVFCREQARAVAAEHDVVVLTWRGDPELRRPLRLDDSIEDGVRTVRLRFWQVQVPKLDGAARLAGCLVALSRLRRSGWRPDVIHAHEYEAGRSALLLARLARVPVVVSEHYSGFRLGTISEREQKRARRVFERVAFVCPDSRDLVRRIRPLAPTARLEAVPNSVDTDVFRPPEAQRRRDGRPLRLVTVGSLVEIKGQRFLIEALAQLAAGRDVELDLLGSGPLKEELSALAQSLGLERRIRFHGTRSHREVAAALREADIFVLPSLSENMPCALLEALVCGLPSVATRVGDVPEVLDEEAGVVVVAGSAQELAAGIAAVESRLDGYDRGRIAASARARYGNAAVSSRWGEVYSAAVASTKQTS